MPTNLSSSQIFWQGSGAAASLNQSGGQNTRLSLKGFASFDITA